MNTMDALRFDLRDALRAARKSPGYTTLVVLTFAVGLGAATAVYSMIRTLLLAPLPFRAAHQLVVLQTEHGGTRGRVSMRELQDLRSGTSVFTDIAAHVPPGGGYTMSDGAGPPYEASALLVASNFFSVLGVPLARGTMWPESFDRERNFGVVFSHALYRQRFGNDPAVFERTLTLDGAPNYRVFGTTPAGFDYPLRTDLYRSIFINPNLPNLEDRSVRNVIGLGRLRADISREAAQAALRSFSSRLAAQYPNSNRGYSIVLTPLRESYVGEARPHLIVLGAAVLLVLLMACTNASNLLLARALQREEELSMRGALGADRARLVQHLLVEAVVLAVAGGVLGSLFAYLGVALVGTMVRHELPSWMALSVDAPAIAFAFTLALVTGILAGTIPAVRLSGSRSLEVIRAGGRGAVGSRRRRALSASLVVAELAFAVVLLTATQSVTATFLRLMRQDPGFRSDELLTFRINLPWFLYDGPRTDQFHRSVLDGLAALPGARGAALSTDLPLIVPRGDRPRFAVVAEGQDLTAQERNPLIRSSVVSPGYFELLGIELARGRAFTEFDRLNTTRVAMLSERTAQRLWPGQDALGKRIRFAADTVWMEVIGVVADIRRDHTGEPEFELHRSSLQVPTANAHYAVRFESNAQAQVRAAEEVVWATDPLQPAWDFRTLQLRRDEQLWRERTSVALFASFALIALLLAVGGVYGLCSFGVAQRTREFGVRLVLGARGARLLGSVLVETSRIAAVGLVAGLAAAALAGVMLRRLLPVLGSADWTGLLSSTLLLSATALLAAAIPALRAARVDPATALRDG
jgi:putative ABC transport system permease protein